MNSKLIKVSTGVVTLASTLYWGVLPVLAIDLCPPAGGTGGVGFTAPGCSGTFSLDKTIGSVIGIMFFAAFVVALVFLVIGGIRWILSGGDKEGTTHAKETVTSALLGLAVVLGSYILINIVLKLVLNTTLTTLTIPVLQTQ